MKKYTAVEARREAEIDMHEEICAEIKENGGCPRHLLPVWRAGHWLGAKLLEEGATNEEEKSITFALGQRIFMKGVDSSYDEAISSLERWRTGRGDRGGLDLAISLLKDTNEQ